MAAVPNERERQVDLVGRDDELERIWRLVDRLASGAGGTILVDGPAGIGKSALLHHVAGRVGSDDLVVDEGPSTCTVVGAEAEREWPYSGLHLVLSSIVGALDAQVRNDMARSVQAFLDGVAQDASSYDVALQLQDVIGHLPRPVLALVDDAHLLDARSQHVLGFVARRIRSAPLALVLAADVAGGAAFQGLPSIYLDELPAADAAHLVRRAGGPSTVTRVADRLVERAGGNPRVLLDVVARTPGEQLAGRCELDRHLPRTAVVQSVVLPELETLDGSRRLALLVAAACEDGQLAPVVHALEGAGEETVAWLLDEHLVESDGTFGFRRPAAGSVIWQESTYAERVAAHRALATAYAGRDRHWQLWHLAHSRYDEDDELAAELERASNAFLQRGDMERALAFARESVRLTSAPEWRVDRMVLAGRLALLDGWADDVVQVARGRFRAETTAEQRADLALLEARARNMLDGEVAAGLITRHVEEIADVDPSRAARLDLVAAVGFAVRMEHGEAARFLALADRYGDYLDDDTAVLHAGASALVSGDVEGALDVVADWPADGAAVGGPVDGTDPLSAVEGRLYLALALSRAERYDEGRRLLRSALDGPLGRSALVRATAHAVTTMLEARAGRLVAARLAATAWEECGVGGAWRAVVPACMIRVQGLLGEEELAWESHQRSADRARRHGDWWATALGHSETGALLLQLGRLDEAVSVLEHARRYALEHLDPSALGVEPDYIEACVRAGEAARAEAALADLEQRARKVPTAWAEHVVARCRALVSEGDESMELFQRAVELHADAVSPVELARTMLCFGERARRLGRRVDAGTWLQRAAVVARECGALAIEVRADEELRASGRRAMSDPAPADELTEAERRIATLVVAGRRNREIAAELFVSVRTVETHLGRIYRKLGVRSRTELAAALAATDDA